MGLLDIIRKPKPPLKPQPRTNVPIIASQAEFITGCLLNDDVPLPQPERGEAQKLANGLAVSAYRRIYDTGEIGASPEMSDTLILNSYRQVGCAFREVGRERGEFIESGVINAIVLKFLELYRTLGADFFGEHLQYEIQKYKREGLRADYSQKRLELFG